MFPKPCVLDQPLQGSMDVSIYGLLPDDVTGWRKPGDENYKLYLSKRGPAEPAGDTHPLLHNTTAPAHRYPGPAAAPT